MEGQIFATLSLPLIVGQILTLYHDPQGPVLYGPCLFLKFYLIFLFPISHYISATLIFSSSEKFSCLRASGRRTLVSTFLSELQEFKKLKLLSIIFQFSVWIYFQRHLLWSPNPKEASVTLILQLARNDRKPQSGLCMIEVSFSVM